jgi:hypothetical protein
MRNGGDSAGQRPVKDGGLKSVSRKINSLPGLPSRAAQNLCIDAAVA